MNRTKILQAAAWAALVVSLGAACARPADKAQTDADAAANSGAASTAPVGRLGDSVVPRRYQLSLQIDPSRDTFRGRVSIDVEVNEPTRQIWLHGKNIEVSEVTVVDANARQIEATYEERLESGVALVSLPEILDSGPATMHFEFTAPFNSSTNALFRVERDGRFYAATQFEPIAARQVFPSFDEPGFKVPFDLTLDTRSGDAAVTTTPLRSSEDLGNGLARHVFETTRPMPTYLLAFVVGPYDVVDFGNMPANSIRDREIALRAIAAHGMGGKLHYALENTDGLLSVLEEYFGTPYPYEKLDLIAMPESFGGAMENIGAITYDEFLLLMDADSPLSQRRTYTVVHAHEMGHMWFGNLVTPEWWNDIWLNESFATWIMNKVADTYWPEGEFDRETLKGALGAMANDSLAAAREIREPIDHNEKIAGAFDGITYQKGGGVLAMLESYVGEENFQAGIRLHMERHQDGNATAEDFIASVAEGSDRVEIEAAFKSFIEQAGVPQISVSLECKDGEQPRIDVRQSRYAPLGSTISPDENLWHIPMCLSFGNGDARQNTCTLLTKAEQSITLDTDTCPTGLHPNAGGTGYYRFAMHESGWKDLIEIAGTLPAAEALVLADSLDAAFRANRVSAETYVSGLAALVGHPAWDVADAATSHFEGITNILDIEQLATAEAALRRIVGPRYKALSDTPGAGADLLRQRMQRFLIVMAKDQEMRGPLAGKAAARLGLHGDPDSSAADASELETIFSIGVQDLGKPFFDRLMDKAIESQDPAFRSAATSALARVEDPVLVNGLQDAVLAGNFKGTEMLGIVFRQMVRGATTDLTYQWIRDNDDVLIGMIPETFRASVVPALGGAFCSAERAVEWQAFVESHADDLPGYERNLAQAVESIKLCAALKQESGSELVAAFKGYGN